MPITVINLLPIVDVKQIEQENENEKYAESEREREMKREKISSHIVSFIQLCDDRTFRLIYRANENEFSSKNLIY